MRYVRRRMLWMFNNVRFFVCKRDFHVKRALMLYTVRRFLPIRYGTVFAAASVLIASLPLSP